MLMLMQLEMYQPIRNDQPPQQQSTTVMQPTGAARPVNYTVRSAPVVPELYDSGQSKLVGIILIIAGVVSLVFPIIAVNNVRKANALLYFGQGFESGFMVSSCALWCFF